MLTRVLEGKRKATEDPESPTAAKRVKVDVSAEPEPAEAAPKAPAIPFPEKVRWILVSPCWTTFMLIQRGSPR